MVFHPLRPEQLEKILEIELGMVQQRVLDAGRGQFLFRVTPEARGFLLREGTDMKYGARHLKRAIERNIVYPLANLSATDQARLGDLLRIDWDDARGTLSFFREAEGVVIPTVPRRRKPQIARAVQGVGAEADAHATPAGPKPATSR